MAFDRFLIAPLNTGWETDLKPWLIPDDAFQQLENAYIFRGRVRKRFGSDLMGYGASSKSLEHLYSRLRIQIATTNGSGNASGTVPGSIFKIGQMFSIGDAIYTVYQVGTPAAMKQTIATTTATFNTTTGAYVFVGAPINSPVFFYPAEPVLGLTQYAQGAINNLPTYAFDTQFAYLFSGGAWDRSGTGVTPLWHGSNDDYYWSYNWYTTDPSVNALFVTNFNATIGTPAITDDPIWYYDGTNWVKFSPLTQFLTAGDTVASCRIIVAFYGRMILLNTIEQNAGGTVNTAYPQRARYSHFGSPISTNAWLEPNQTSGGFLGDGANFIDASTDEEIVSAEFIKNRLIVYFERSTWELVYTGNQVDPFLWQKINTELGSEATFSTVPFDKVVLTIGNTGVHACNGANVERIDSKIPDYVFTILDKVEGVTRVAGIRDYYTELVYWTFPSTDQNPNAIYPTKVLVYNYRNNSWAVNDDSITTWGYFEQQPSPTWATTFDTWESIAWTWDSGPSQSQFRQIIGGNQQGFVFIVSADITRNAPSLLITNMVNSGARVQITAINHNLAVNDYVYIEGALGSTNLNDHVYRVATYIDENNFSIADAQIIGTYSGNGTVARVSNMNILSKQWNPYVNRGKSFYLARIDFGVSRTEDGKVTVDYYPSSTNLSMIEEGGPNGTNMLLGNNVLETSPYPTVFLEQLQTRLWHPIYFQTDGDTVQINIYMNKEQITDPDIAFSDFQLEGIVLHTMPTSQRLQ